jgi:SAM-dependent methyltransferase
MRQLNNINTYIGHNELFIIENLKNYNTSIVSKCEKYVKSNFKVLDFGAGIGTLLEPFESKFKIRPYALEIDTLQGNIIREKGFYCFDNLNQVEQEMFDFIYSSNVFEHIEGDNIELIELAKKLKPKCYLYLYLPANNFLWSELDDKVLHYRRYNDENIKKLIENSNLDIIDVKYCDPIGAIFTLLFKLFRIELKDINSKKLKILDKYFFPFNFILEKLLIYKFGKNVMLILKKK